MGIGIVRESPGGSVNCVSTLIETLQDFFRKLNGTPEDPALFRAWQTGMLSGNRSVPAPDCVVDKADLSTIFSLCEHLGISTTTLPGICYTAFAGVDPRFHIVTPEEGVLAVLAGDVPDGMLSRRAERYRKFYRISTQEHQSDAR